MKGVDYETAVVQIQKILMKGNNKALRITLQDKIPEEMTSNEFTIILTYFFDIDKVKYLWYY